MSRIPDGAMRIVPITIVVLGSVLLGTGCQELDGRNANRHGNQLFREMQFIDAAASYEKALKTVDDPIIHYNLGLAYSKVYRGGSDKPVLLGESTEAVCNLVPGTKLVDARVCIKRMEQRTDEKENVRRFPECNETDVCSSSYECRQARMCGADSKQIADLAATHFQTWIKAQPSDEALKEKQTALRKLIEEAEKAANKSRVDELQKRLEEYTLKNDVRTLTTQVWIDTDQFDKAIAYWEGELSLKPNDEAIMGKLAGINLKAGDWRKSIEWYHKVATIAKDVDSKVGSLQFIGNVAWSKLNSKTLSQEESVELADLGIGALQQAASLQPKLAKLWGLQASLYNFRSVAQPQVYAQAIDRASAEDLKKLARVLVEEAKKQKEGLAPTPAPTPPTPTPAPSGATPPNPPAPASPMSGGPTKTSGG